MNPIDKIKQVRDELGIGLAEAKELVERFETPEKAVEEWRLKEAEMKWEEAEREYVDPKYWKDDFYWEHRPIDPEDLEKLKRLSKNYCKRLWAEFVTEHSDHLMRTDAEKLWKIKNNQLIKEYNWETDSDENNLSGLGSVLNPVLNWNPKEEVYLFFGRYSGFKMNWELFLKYCHPLLFHTYANVLVNVNDPKVVIFEEHGYIQIGERIST